MLDDFDPLMPFARADSLFGNATQGLYSLSARMSRRKISCSLEATRFGNGLNIGLDVKDLVYRFEHQNKETKRCRNFDQFELISITST